MIDVARRIARRGRSSAPASSPWSVVLERGTPERSTSAEGVRVLNATSVGGHPAARVVDSVVATALWLRGAEPRLLLCDAALPACEAAGYTQFPDPHEFARRGPRRLCGSCFGRGRAYLEPLPIQLDTYTDFVERADGRRARSHAAAMDVDECLAFELDGVRLGPQVRAGVFRFFGKAHLDDEDASLVADVVRRYAAAAVLSATVGRRVLETFEPDCVVAHHGVYVPQGVLGEVARKAGVRVVHWAPSYRSATVIFSHGDTYHRTMLDEPTERWESMPFGEAEERALLDYLASRRRGRGDWTWITPEAGLRTDYQERIELLEALKLDSRRPIFGLLTNVLWDAALYYRGHAFDDMLEWLWATIDFFAERPDLQLLVRIHPHEVKEGNREPVADEIARRYPTLPANVKVVPFDHPFNTYALMDLCRAVLIYGTKTGVELTPFGMPVVVAADAWIRGKRLTTDARTPEEYQRILENLANLRPLDDETVLRARRYAYHYFFRRMIPLRAVASGADDVVLQLESLHDILPGRDPGLDVICNGILTGSPFEYDPAR